MRRLGILLVLLMATGCSGPRFIDLRIRPQAIGRKAKDAARELVHGVLHTIGRVVDVVLR